MGNQREVIQLTPSRRAGFAIAVSRSSADSIRVILSEHRPWHFYTNLLDVGDPGIVPGFVEEQTVLGILRDPHFVIQNGGKMRCGYDNFINHLSRIAPYIPDASFLVGDEEDYVDLFTFESACLQYKRIHSGGWQDLTEFIGMFYPTPNTATLGEN